MENKYIVYQHITPNGMVYTGVTKNLKKRNSQHKSKSNPTSLTPYVLKYGWDIIQHIVLYENLTREEALKKEDELILKTIEQGVCINQVRSGLIEKDNVKAYKTEYNKTHKIERKTYNVEYRKTHKEEMVQYRKKVFSTIEGRIYSRVANYNRRHPNDIKETPMEAKQKYLEFGLIPTYIKTSDFFDKIVA